VNIKIEVSHTQLPPGFYKFDFTLLDDFAFLDDPGTLDLLDLPHVYTHTHTHTHTDSHNVYIYIYLYYEIHHFALFKKSEYAA